MRRRYMWTRLLKIKSLLAVAAALTLIGAIACASEETPAPAAAPVTAPVAPAPAVATGPAPTAIPYPVAPAQAPVAPAAAVARPAPVTTAPRAQLGYTPYTPATIGPGEFYSKVYNGPRPTTYTESPRLAELVKAGKPCTEQTVYANWTAPATCEPLMDRLPHPDDIAVFNVPQEVGIYGGIKRILDYNVTTIFHHASSFSLMSGDYNTVDNYPYVAKAVSMSDDGREYTVTLRRDVKWSDGKPLTREDFEWVWEDLNYNKERYPKGFGTKDPITGNPVQFTMVDESHFKLSFDTPYYTFLEGKFSGTPYVRGSAWFAHKPWASQWVPKYNDPDELQAKLDAFGVEDWIKLIVKIGLHRVYYQPWIGPYVKPPNGELWNAGTDWEWRTHDWANANPYFWAVDPHGQQLPYIDSMDALAIESREVAVFRTMKGESDGPTGKGYQLPELPLYHQNMVKGDFSIGGRWGIAGNEYSFDVNHDYVKDAEIGRLLRTRDFRRALHVAIDRDAISENRFLGIGIPGNHVPHPNNSYYPGDEWMTRDIAQDLGEANRLMASMGYKKNAEGMYERLDGTGVLTLDWEAAGASLGSELIASDWRELGIEVSMKPGGAQYGNSGNPTGYATGDAYLGSPGRDHYGHSPWWVPWNSNFPIYGDRGASPCAGQYYFTGGEEGCAPTGGDPAFTDIFGNMAPAGTYPTDLLGDLIKIQNLIKEGNAIPFHDPRRKEVGQEVYKLNIIGKHRMHTIAFAVFSIVIWRNNLRNIPVCCVGSYGDTSIQYFEDGMDNINNPGNRSKKYKSYSFAQQ